MADYILSRQARNNLLESLSALASLCSILRLAQCCAEDDMESALSYVADKMEDVLDDANATVVCAALREVSEDE